MVTLAAVSRSTSGEFHPGLLEDLEDLSSLSLLTLLDPESLEAPSPSSESASVARRALSALLAPESGAEATSCQRSSNGGEPKKTHLILLVAACCE